MKLTKAFLSLHNLAKQDRLGRMGGFAMGPGGKCVCLECGYEDEHGTGEPCMDRDCPQCGAKMARSEDGVNKANSVYPSSDELESRRRKFRAEQLEQEAALRDQFGTPEQRSHERMRVKQEWDKIDADERAGLDEGKIWRRHMQRMRRMASSVGSPNKARRRAAHLNAEGLKSAGKLFEERAQELENVANATKNPHTRALKSLQGFDQWVRKETIEWGLVRESAVNAARDLFGTVDMNIIDSMIEDLPSKNPKDTDDAVQIIVDMLRSDNPQKTVQKARGKKVKEGETVRRKDGYYKKVGGKFVKLKEGGGAAPQTVPTSGRPKEGKKGKKYEGPMSEDEKKGVVDAILDADFEGTEGELITEYADKTLPQLEEAVKNVNLGQPQFYLKKADIQPSLRANTDFMRMNKGVGRAEGQARAYASRGFGEKVDEGYGVDEDDKRYYLAASLVMRDVAERLATLRDSVKGA